MLTCAIIDDNELHRDYLLSLIEQLSLAECIGMAEDAIQARELLQRIRPDFIFLDIEMPTMTGIELMGSLNQKPFVVFVTSHKDFALEAFDLNAVDYLTKPIKKERLLSAVEKVEILVKMYKKSLDGELMGMPENSYFFVKDKGVLHRVFYKDVLYIQAMGDFSTIFLENGQKKIALVGIKNFEQQLSSDNFLRISRTHLVNTQKITALTNDSVFMEKIEISIGSTFQEEVFKKIVDGKVIKRFV